MSNDFKSAGQAAGDYGHYQSKGKHQIINPATLSIRQCWPKGKTRTSILLSQLVVRRFVNWMQPALCLQCRESPCFESVPQDADVRLVHLLRRGLWHLHGSWVSVIIASLFIAIITPPVGRCIPPRSTRRYQSCGSCFRPTCLLFPLRCRIRCGILCFRRFLSRRLHILRLRSLIISSLPPPRWPHRLLLRCLFISSRRHPIPRRR